MKRFCKALTVVAAVAAIHTTAPIGHAQRPGPVVYEGARIITGAETPPIEDGAIIVENGRFVKIGTRAAIGAPAGAVHVNLAGKTIVPGFIDAHAHLGTQDYRNWTDKRENYTRDNLLDQLSRASYFGVAGIFTAGSDFGDLWYTLRDEIKAGKHPSAARWVSAGPGLISPDAVAKDKTRQDAYGAGTPEEARKAVRELASHGVIVAKAWIEGRPGRGGIAPLGQPEYEAFIDEAHKHGIKTYIHAHDLGDAKKLLRAGVDGFAHKIDYPGPDEELLTMFRARGAKLYMTLTQVGVPGAERARVMTPDPLLRATILPRFLKQLQDESKPQTPEELEQARVAWDKVKEMTRQFIATGIRIGVGTDTARLLPDRLAGWGMHVEMEEMVESGMTPAQVLVAGTRTNAEWLGLDDLGTITPGKTATFVVLDANPLDDIKNTRRIASMYIAGRELERARLASGWVKP